MPKVGFVTIGQVPRDDILGDIGPLLRGVEIVEAGALDGLSHSELAELAPGPGEAPLVSRLRHGSPVVVSGERIEPLLKRSVEKVLAQGADLVALLCTGEFPGLEGSSLLLPSRILYHFVSSITTPKARAGIIVPLAEQKASSEERWGPLCGDLMVASISPYPHLEANLGEIESWPERDLVVMDCLGYSQEAKERVKRIVNCPVVLPRTLLARAILELI